MIKLEKDAVNFILKEHDYSSIEEYARENGVKFVVETDDEYIFETTDHEQE